MIKIDIISNQALQFFIQMGNNIESPIVQAVKKVGLLAQNRAKTYSPFRTGNLRRSIQGRQNALEYTVGTNVIYSRVHEWGHTFPSGRTIRPYKGRGYFQPALKDAEREAGAILRDRIIKAIAKWT